MKRACLSSCHSACDEGLEEYRASIASALGLAPTREDLELPKKKCTRSCAYECQKEGSGYTFTINYAG